MTPRLPRRSVHVVPAVQTRRIVYEQPSEQPIVVRRKAVPADHQPERVLIRRSPPSRPPPPPPPAPRPTTYYYVDEDNHLIPQTKAPPVETPRKYVVERRNPPSARTIRVVRRRIQTPPPPSSDAWHTGPRRLINSDTEAIQRQQRLRRIDANNSPTPQIKPEVYYLEAAPNIRSTPIETPVSGPPDQYSPPPPVRMIRQGAQTRNPERRNTRMVEPVVVRRVYKNYPPSRLGPPDHHLVNDENRPPVPIRQNRKNPPPPPPSKQQQSPPEFRNRRPTAKNLRSPPEPDIHRMPVKHNQSPPELDNGHSPLAKRPSIFYIRNREEYE